MRRPRPFRGYSRTTASIVDANFEQWQLTRRDAREGLHRILNEIVTLTETLNDEAEYIENMFMPDRMDLSEEWVLYTTEDDLTSGDVTLSGEPLSESVVAVSSLDELIAGGFETLIPYLSASYPSGCEVQSLVAIDTNRWYYLCPSGVFLQTDGGISQTAILPPLPIWSGEVVLGEGIPVYAFEEEFDTSSVSLTKSGVAVPFDMLLPESATGIWESDYDVDNDGIIWEYELQLLERARGKSVADFGVSAWSSVAWADGDGDGYISESDYALVRASIPSLAPGSYGALKVPHGVGGTFTLTYLKDGAYTTSMIHTGNGYEFISSTDGRDRYSRIAYDPKSDVFFGIVDGCIEAFRYNRELYTVTHNIPVYFERWSAACVAIDLDVQDGYLYVLVGDGERFEFRYGDVWDEYVEGLYESATVELPSGFIPSLFSTTADGYFTLSSDSEVIVFRPLRDRYADVDGKVYMNRRHQLATEDGDIPSVPFYLFNSFDSFAYSYGIARPWGCDNYHLRELIYDFNRYLQDHSAQGMAYGMLREFGYSNERIRPSGEFDLLPAPLSSVTSLAGEVPLEYESDGFLYLSGGGCQIRVSGTVLYQDVIADEVSQFLLSGNFVDGNGDLIATSYLIPARHGTHTPRVRVRSYADSDFLEEEGLTCSGVPLPSLVSLVSSLETDDDCTFSAAQLNVTPALEHRIAWVPVLETTYDMMCDTYLSGDLEVTL